MISTIIRHRFCCLWGLDDSLIANAEDILIGDPAKLQMLNDRYGTQTVIVAHALADVEGSLASPLIFGEEKVA